MSYERQKLFGNEMCEITANLFVHCKRSYSMIPIKSTYQYIANAVCVHSQVQKLSKERNETKRKHRTSKANKIVKHQRGILLIENSILFEINMSTEYVHVCTE